MFSKFGNLHRLLTRQLKKLNAESYITNEPISSFVQLVNESYIQNDRERRLLENALEVTSQELTGVNKQLKLFIENAPTGIAMLDKQFRYLFTSRRWLEDRQLLGIDVVGKNHYELQPNTPFHWKEIHQRCLKGESLSCDEDKITLPNGRVGWIRWEIKPWQNADGTIGGLIIFSEDITESKQARDDLRVASVAFQSSDGMIVTDADGIVLKVNDAFIHLLGYQSDELIGKNTSHFQSTQHHDNIYFRNLWEAISSEGKWEGSIWNLHKDGRQILCWLSISAVRNSSNAITHYIGIYSNATDPKEADRKILELAYYDPLTNLPNRRLLLDRLNQARISASRNNVIGAILLIDIDKFKSINDTLGHDAGDHILITVAQHLRKSLREIDTAARLGGDEFIVLIPDLDDNIDHAIIALKVITDKLLASIAIPIRYNGITIRTTASIGIAIFPDSSKESNDLLKEADLALYQAKNSGRNAIRFFDQLMQDQYLNKINIEAGLRQALDEDRFLLHYQPQVDPVGNCIGAEVLLRWKRTDASIVAPDEFISIAEESGLIIAIGEWVLKTACDQLNHWGTNKQTAKLRLSVNISASQFMHPDFTNTIKSILIKTGANPELLTLELTESLLLINLDDVIRKINDLKNIGIRFSLDDFGTGYSSLNYLKRLPLDELKIDRSFVRDLATSLGDRAIIHTMISLAQNLNLSVVAEGIETLEQRDYLLAEGCQCFQGYLYGKPVPIENFRYFEYI